jgi:hypothetical protein
VWGASVAVKRFVFLREHEAVESCNVVGDGVAS